MHEHANFPSGPGTAHRLLNMGNHRKIEQNSNRKFSVVEENPEGKILMALENASGFDANQHQYILIGPF